MNLNETLIRLSRSLPVTFARIAHDVRCLCAVYHPETGRFGRDNREDVTVSNRGKILSNLFSRGTADVGGTAVVARSADRAAAAVALRAIRAGTVPAREYSVTMRNRSGATYNETVRFEFDSENPITDHDSGADRSLPTVRETARDSGRRIDDVVFHGVSKQNGKIVPCAVCGKSTCRG